MFYSFGFRLFHVRMFTGADAPLKRGVPPFFPLTRGQETSSPAVSISSSKQCKHNGSRKRREQNAKIQMNRYHSKLSWSNIDVQRQTLLPPSKIARICP